MKKLLVTLIISSLAAFPVLADAGNWEGRELSEKNVHASVVTLGGEKVLKVERDLSALPFDPDRLSETVDESTFVLIPGVAFKDGTIAVKVLSRLQPDAPDFARGFIGIAFHINSDISRFESIYIRPANGRTDDVKRKQNATQYFAYPDFKFDRLRKEAPGEYESPADIGLDEWIQLKVVVKGKTAELFINDATTSVLTVDDLTYSETSGAIGLWVDIGTEGYFSDLRVTQ